MNGLRALGANQQVGLLFVALFGVLAVGTAATAWRLRGELEASERRLQRLAELRDRWIASGFTLDRRDLLAG